MALADTLRDRGYVHQFSAKKLEEITDGKKRTVYLGVDPTADSIHAGNLVVYMMLRRFADAGHDVILIIGGGTALAGDPKPDVERSLTDPAIIAERAEKLQAQAEKLLGGVSVRMINNADWLTKLNLMEFLRDTGKHFTVNNLIKKDAISARMQSEEGISVTEFSYPLLQAYDFWHLYKTYKCDVQIGGSDQWGNIIAGVELIRRKEGAEAFAISCPLIVDKATGKKFGKSEGNAVWLDPGKTRPFEFYQFWINASDESVADYLKLFTLLSLEEIEGVMQVHSASPNLRHAQTRLAYEVTALVHGEEIARAVQGASHVLFGDTEIADLSGESRTLLEAEAPSYTTKLGVSIIEVLVNSKLAESRSDARRQIDDGGVYLNGAKISDANRNIMKEDFQNAPLALLKRGRRNVVILKVN